MVKVQYLHCYINNNIKKGSMTNALDRVGCRFITQNDFIVSFLDEFGIHAPTMSISKHLRLLYETFPGWEVQKVDSCAVLCTYLSLVYKDIVEVNPRKVFMNFCDIFCTACNGTINLKEVLNAFYVGCVTSADCVQFTDKVMTCFYRIHPEAHQEHTGKVTNEISIRKSELMTILEVNPCLMINFRESILSKLSVGERLDMLHSKEVR